MRNRVQAAKTAAYLDGASTSIEARWQFSPSGLPWVEQNNAQIFAAVVFWPLQAADQGASVTILGIVTKSGTFLLWTRVYSLP
jgi:hypothetical protein